MTTIDFAKHTNEDLLHSLANINRESYPDNYAACQAEIARRRGSGEWDEVISSHGPVAVLVVAVFMALFGFLFLLGVLGSRNDFKSAGTFAGAVSFVVLWIALILLIAAFSIRSLRKVSLGSKSLIVYGLTNGFETVPFEQIEGVSFESRKIGRRGRTHWWFARVRTRTPYKFGKEFTFSIRDGLDDGEDIRVLPHIARFSEACNLK